MIMHPGIKLRHIRAFLAIAAAGGLTPVARAQGITQPALSRTLTDLETLLGHRLFLRQGRRLALTEAGTAFRQHAAAAVQALEAGARALAPGPAGRLRLGVLPTVAARLLPRLALRFRADRPTVTLAVETGPHHFLTGLLRDGALDAMLGRQPAPPDLAGLRFDHLYDEDVVLAVRPGHPAATRPLAQALPGWPLVLPPASALIRPGVDVWLAAQGLPHLRPAVETASLALGRGLCLAADALWFISRGVVAEELSRGLLSSLPLPGRAPTGAVGLTRRAGDMGDDLALLWDLARAAATEG